MTMQQKLSIAITKCHHCVSKLSTRYTDQCEECHWGKLMRRYIGTPEWDEAMKIVKNQQ